ncbi:MAG: sporulation protein YjcZ [Firmicutes bacterium]|nr:sporulation protein YjcZ [Bacillota bacterium]
MNNQCCETNNHTGSSFVFILVLYILLAIILGSWVSY